MNQLVASSNEKRSVGLLKQQRCGPLPFWHLETQALEWLEEYIDRYDLALYDPFTHGCAWGNDAYRVFMRRRRLFEESRWQHTGPELFKFWTQAGIAPLEHGLYKRGKAFEKRVPYFKPPAAAKLFVGDDPVAAARHAYTRARE